MFSIKKMADLKAEWDSRLAAIGARREWQKQSEME
jgi:hypothetical protein